MGRFHTVWEEPQTSLLGGGSLPKHIGDPRGNAAPSHRCPQAASSDSEGLTYMELQAVTPGAQPPNPAVDPQPSVIYAEVAAGRRC